MQHLTTVISGNFTTGEGAKGNFSARNATGNFFIHKRLMATLNFNSDADLKDENGEFKPFYAILQEREITTRNAEGELTDQKAKRLQAVSIFKTKAQMLEAVNADAKLQIEASNQLKQFATTQGLDQKTVEALLQATV